MSCLDAFLGVMCHLVILHNSLVWTENFLGTVGTDLGLGLTVGKIFR